jgi:protein gp37
MGAKTNIDWCDSTINPVMGCDGCELHGPACELDSCYAAALVGRYAGLPGWPKSFDKPEFFEGRIEKACRWSDLTGTERKDKPWLNGYPRTIFLCDLADPFTESAPQYWLGPYLARMARAPHIWIICTKRPARMRQFFERWGCPPNFWLLTTVTSLATVGRIEELLRIPDATVRGVSLEPLLCPLDLRHINLRGDLLDALYGEVYSEESGCIRELLPWLAWVIVGGESGAGARHMQPHWAAEIREDCWATGTAFFMKQMAGRKPIPADLLTRQMPWGPPR